MTEIRFFVAGIPAPGGSKRAFVPVNPRTKEPYRSKTTGRIVVNVIDDAGQRNKDWKASVKMTAVEAIEKWIAEPATELLLRTGAFTSPFPLTGAIEIALIFQMPRPKHHYRSNGIALKPGAPLHHVIRPDAGKLARSTQDACTGILWRDDAQIVKETHEKVYSDQPGAWIIVRELESQDLFRQRELSA